METVILSYRLHCCCRCCRFSDAIDDEPMVRDLPTLECDVDLRLEEISVRCVTLSNIIRGLSFVPQNEKVRYLFISYISQLQRHSATFTLLSVM